MLLLDNSFIILKYNVFIDRAPCTKLHKREQKDRTKNSAEFPNHVLKDYDSGHRAAPKGILQNDPHRAGRFQ